MSDDDKKNKDQPESVEPNKALNSGGDLGADKNLSESSQSAEAKDSQSKSAEGSQPKSAEGSQPKPAEGSQPKPVESSEPKQKSDSSSAVNDKSQDASSDPSHFVDGSHPDPLLGCLLLLASAHGINTSAATVLSGLPLQHEQLVPSMFTRAAERAGFTSQIIRNPLERLNSALFPVILILKGNHACLLLSVDKENELATVVYPELGSTQVDVPLAELLERYSGRAIYARPKKRFEARVTDINVKTGGHWFWDVVKQHRELFRDIWLTALVINFFALAMPVFVMNVYDRVVPNFAVETLWVLAIGALIILLADLCLKIMRAWFVDLAASRIDITLSSSIMARVLGMKMSHRPASIGSFASGLQSFEAVRSFIGSSTIIAFVDLPFVILFTVVIGALASWVLVVPILVGAFVCLLYAAAVQHKMHELSVNGLQAGAHRNSVLVESLNSLESLKMLGAEGRMQRYWEESTIFLSRNSSKSRLLSGSVVSGAGWIQQAVGISIIIAGVYMIVNGDLTQGGLILSYMLSSRIMGPISQAAALLMQYHQAASALEGASEMMSKEVERPDGKNWISRPRLSGGIEFKNVCLQYPDDEREVLRDVSFKINPGERVALLGKNGSGKTTIEKVIAGLYGATKGHVLIDDIDIGQLDIAELRRNIGYVEQDVTLFLGTLRENITMGNPAVSDEKLLAVIKMCGLTNFVNNHPSGLSMQVGERGNLLSVGQRQSISIARALINDPSILLMDEPTGAMDHSSEEAFKNNLDAFSKGKTLLVVTHRTSLLSLVDRIIVVDEGKIVADGPKDRVVEALRQGRVGRAG